MSINIFANFSKDVLALQEGKETKSIVDTRIKSIACTVFGIFCGWAALATIPFAVAVLASSAAAPALLIVSISTALILGVTAVALAVLAYDFFIIGNNYHTHAESHANISNKLVKKFDEGWEKLTNGDCMGALDKGITAIGQAFKGGQHIAQKAIAEVQTGTPVPFHDTLIVQHLMKALED